MDLDLKKWLKASIVGGFVGSVMYGFFEVAESVASSMPSGYTGFAVGFTGGFALMLLEDSE